MPSAADLQGDAGALRRTEDAHAGGVLQPRAAADLALAAHRAGARLAVDPQEVAELLKAEHLAGGGHLADADSPDLDAADAEPM
ncbi:MAG TPA: hypothetical protein VGN83_08340 [Falsiroseomonas sp.]|jgi:hypothetical protein|nr:hypothetical protein [Falsiroseomonas sp.]